MIVSSEVFVEGNKQAALVELLLGRAVRLSWGDLELASCCSSQSISSAMSALKIASESSLVSCRRDLSFDLAADSGESWLSMLSFGESYCIKISCSCSPMLPCSSLSNKGN
jgi:hypothetical protein